MKAAVMTIARMMTKMVMIRRRTIKKAMKKMIEIIATMGSSRLILRAACGR